MLQRGHGGDGCDLASTLCKYDLRKGGLFVLSWTRVPMCGVGVRSILLLPLVTINVCIWRMFVFIPVVVNVWGLWECLLCSGVAKDSVCLCKGCDGCCIFFLNCEVWSYRSSSSCHQTIFFHRSAHCFLSSLNIMKSSKVYSALPKHMGCRLCRTSTSARWFHVKHQARFTFWKIKNSEKEQVG